MDDFNSILSDFFWCGRFANIKPIVDNLNISYAIVKGEVLSKQIYGKTGERICSDIDFLVPRSCLKIVENKLADNGFSCVSIKRSDAVTWLVSSHQVPPWVKKDKLYGDIIIDLNFDIFWGEYAGTRINIEEFLSDTVEIDVHGVKVKALPTPKAFIQLILHHYKEMNSIYILSSRNSIKDEMFRDVYYFLKNNYSNLLPNDLYVLCNKYEIVPYVYYMLYYTGKVFENEIIDDYLKLFKTPFGEDLLDCYGLNDKERKKWRCSFSSRLNAEDLYPFMKDDLTKSDHIKINLNRSIMGDAPI